MLKIVILAAVATLCLSQDLGDDDYIACDKCKIPDDQFPEEGKMVCFEVKNVSKTYKALYQKCYQVECGPFDFFCVPGEKCDWVRRDKLVQECQLERKTAYKWIDKISVGEYHIYSPQYYTQNASYPNNTYCVWNVANSGFVSFHIMDQQLQEPANISDCHGPGCECPDSVKITMGTSKIKLCGSTMPSTPYLPFISSNGLHLKFCSDNKHTAKGFFIKAYTTLNGTAIQKRETKQLQRPNEVPHNSTGELENVTCHYDYMMLISQPDVPCPDNVTILSMLQHHNRFMSVFKQNEGMCSRMGYPTIMSSMMPMMNKIEMCAVEYLYRTKDQSFARIAVDSADDELSGVAHTVIENILDEQNTY